MGDRLKGKVAVVTGAGRGIDRKPKSEPIEKSISPLMMTNASPTPAMVHNAIRVLISRRLPMGRKVSDLSKKNVPNRSSAAIRMFLRNYESTIKEYL